MSQATATPEYILVAVAVAVAGVELTSEAGETAHISQPADLYFFVFAYVWLVLVIWKLC